MTKHKRIPFHEYQHLTLTNVSWDLYQRLLDELGDRPIRMTFDRGNLEIMAPLLRHERWRTRIGRMVETMALEIDLPIEPLGSTTFKRRKLRRGLEPDECYYVQNAESVRGKDELNLAVDPPPDLAIDVELIRRSIKREPIYRALGVPEFWQFRAHRLVVKVLRADTTYATSTTSAAFPFLPMGMFEAFLLRMELEDQNAVLREFRDWVRTLKR